MKNDLGDKYNQDFDDETVLEKLLWLSPFILLLLWIIYKYVTGNV